MNKEELFETLGEIDPSLVKKAGSYRAGRRSVPMKWLAAAACAVIVVGALAGAVRTPEALVSTVAMEAEYPPAVGENLSAEEYLFSSAYTDWWAENRQRAEATRPLQDEMRGYYLSLMQELLPSSEGNTLCSPLNSYIAFSMLAEICGGSSRQQILRMLGASDIGTLRENNAALWQSNYADTPALKSLLANSLWLSGFAAFREEPLLLLREYYRASAFSGVPGSQEMNEALRQWTDRNTGGLLSEYTKDMFLDENTVLGLVSALYYKAMWSSAFADAETAEGIFRGISGDSVKMMMHKTIEGDVYRGENFTALGLDLLDSGAVYFYLPDEGVAVDSLLESSELMNVLDSRTEQERWTAATVRLTLPKLKISAKIDLIGTLAKLGVTDILNEATADFSPLLDRSGLYLSKAEQAVTLELDEKGILGAAYTELGVREKAEPGAREKMDFTLDRPFLFIVTGADGSVLFAGAERK